MTEYIELTYKIVIIIGVLTGGIMYIFRVIKRRGQETRLAELGKLRTKAVNIRNEANRPLQGTELDEWLGKADRINKALVNKTKKYDLVLGEYLDTLDKMDHDTSIEGDPKDYDPEQLRIRNGLSERLKRIKEMIDKYYSPKYYN